MTAHVATDALAPVTESSEEDLATLRYVLDLSLQPIDRFDGFTKIEQIGGSALRYQLCFLGYTLAMAQFTRTPAFTGYQVEAQRNLITKMCDKRVWGYWATESLLGYGKFETDPIRHANVMYSGYFGVLLGLYETLNDSMYAKHGSLPLRWNSTTTHRYDFGRIGEAIRTNMLARPNCPQYPCEPHLIYPICNAFAFNTLAMHDRLHGTEWSEDILAGVRRSYREDGWQLRSGRFIPGRIGPRINACPPVLGYDAGMVFWLNALMPDIADKTWTTIRRKFIDFDDSKAKLRGQNWMRVDLGNYSRTKGTALTNAFVVAAAAEVGETELAQALNRAVEDEGTIERRLGARRYAGVSTMTNAQLALARFARSDGMAQLIRGEVPPVWRTGPVLDDAAYPDVLVGKAVSDGTALELVLRPGATRKRVRLGLARLNPGSTYRATGTVDDTVVADPGGHATVEVDLAGRTDVSIRPVSTG